MDISIEMQQALHETSAQVLPLEGVRGMDIGLDDSGELAIRILVPDPSEPPADLPETAGGFPVSVIEGDPRIDHDAPDLLRHVAATGGIEVGRRRPLAGSPGDGTLGMVFRDRFTNEPLALSCAHVLCGTDPFGTFAVGDQIQQPAPVTSPPPSERLGALQRWVIPQTPPVFPLISSPIPSGHADAAVCSVDRAFQGSDVEDVGPVAGLAGVQVGDRVKKRGKTTGLTFGKVSGLFAWHRVGDTNGNPIWWLIGQLEIKVDLNATPSGVWSQPGDSGAVVLNLQDEVVGMHWGATPGGGVGYATDIFAITQALDLVPG